MAVFVNRALSRCNLIFAVALTAIVPLASFCCVSAQAKSPGKGEMLVYKATGTMWGSTFNCFSEHAFSLRSNRGVALWRDNEPEHVVLINPENKTYFKESLLEYLDDNHYGTNVPLLPDSYEIKPHESLSGFKAVETIFRKDRNSFGRGYRRLSATGNGSIMSSFKKMKAEEPGSLLSEKTGKTNMQHGASKTANTAKSNTSPKNPDTPVQRPGLKNEVDVARVVSLKEVTLPPVMIKAWSRIMLTNTQSGFAVSIKVKPRRNWQDGDVTIQESSTPITFSSVKFVPVDPKRFEIPAGFVKAKDKSSFYLSENGELKSSDLDDFFRSTVK